MLDYIPYRTQNLLDGARKPSSVYRGSYAYHFWMRALFQRLCSTVEFKIPDSWNRARDFFEAVLFNRGYLAVFDTKEFGVTFQPCQLSGFDWFYQPTTAIVSNPKLSKEFTIGEDCSLIKLTNDYTGLYDLLDYYSTKLATMDSAVDINIINSKFSYVLGAKNKAAAQATKMIFDKINAGEPTVVYDKSIIEGLGDEEPFEFIERNSLKNGYITSDLLNDFQTILNQFDTEIGIPTTPGEKRERMIQDEAQSKFADASSRVALWNECLSNSIDEVNKMFGTDISFEFKFLEQMNRALEENSEEQGDNNIKEVLSRWGIQ